MNSEVAKQLKVLIKQYGTALCNDPKRCRALLMDHCGEYVKEIRVLCMALDINLPQELLLTKSTPLEIQRLRLAKKLTDEYAMAEDAALWSIDTWAFALRVNVTLPRQSDAKVSKKADKLITLKSKINNNSSHSAANGHQLQKHPLTMPLPLVKTQALLKHRSKTPLVIGLGIGMFLLIRMVYPGIVDMISDAIPSDNNAQGIAGDTQALSIDRQVSGEAEKSTDRVVIFHNVNIAEITSTTAWAEIYLTVKKGGLFYWDISDDSVLSDLLGFEQAIYDENIGLLIDGLQPGTSYRIRPVIETDAEIYYGDWVTFTTK